jgi:DNA polymerase-3 subunit beta
MASILKDAGDEEIRLESDKDVVTVWCGDGFYRVLGESVENFPPVPEFKETGTKLPGAVLADMIKKTSMAAAEERSRYSLNGLYISFEGKKVTMAATDGRRLAVREEKLKSKGEDASGIVPVKGVATIRRVVENSDEAEISLSDNMVMVRASGGEVYSRLIEGKFPDYKRVIPVGNDKRIVLSREDLLSIVRRASLLCSGESRAVKFSLGKGELKFSSRTAEVGEAELSLPVSYDGPAIEIDFNPDYIADVLRVLDTDEVVLELKDGECAGMIREGKTYTYVVMPLSA